MSRISKDAEAFVYVLFDPRNSKLPKEAYGKWFQHPNTQNLINNTFKEHNRNISRPVIGTLSGRIFESTNAAYRALGVPSSTFRLRLKQGKECAGEVWKLKRKE